MSGATDKLDEPLREPARRLGIEELIARLTDARRQRKMDHEHDYYCPECHSGLTFCDRLGELGHRAWCPRKKEKYHGRAGIYGDRGDDDE